MKICDIESGFEVRFRGVVVKRWAIATSTPVRDFVNIVTRPGVPPAIKNHQEDGQKVNLGSRVIRERGGK